VVQLTAFFTSTTPPDPNPSGSVALLLDRFSFLYMDMDPSEPDNVFRSGFVQQLFQTSHLNAIKGHIRVPTLDMDSLVEHGVIGALGLCGAAVMFKGLLSKLLN